MAKKKANYLAPKVTKELSPLRIEEVKEGKVWSITYEMENFVFTDPKAMEGFKMLGVDFDSEKFASKVKPNRKAGIESSG